MHETELIFQTERTGDRRSKDEKWKPGNNN